MQFDEWGNIVHLTNPDGTTVSAEYNLLTGAVKRQINEKGVVTEHRFDKAGNPTALIEAVGTDVERQSKFTYDTSGNLIATARPGDAVVGFEYDVYGNITKRIDPLEGMEIFSYDALNRLKTWTNQRGHQYHYAYDNGGHLIKITDPLGYIVTHEYDAVGNLVKVTNENDMSTILEYDAYDRILMITDALGYLVTFEYDLDGNLVKWTDQNNHNKKMTYDLEGNLVSVIDAESNTISFNYTFSDAPYCASCPPHQNTKRPREVVYPTTSEQYEYNQRGQITKKTQVVDQETAYEWQYDYDATGNLILEIDPENHQQSYQYDALNRLIVETDPSGFKTKYTYDSRDNLLSTTDPDGIVVLYTYDLNDRIVSEKMTGNNATRYVYDAVGNIIKTIEPSGYSTSFDYNIRNELTGSLDELGNTTSFEYDPVGHLTKEVSQDGQIFEYVYDDVGKEIKTILPSTAFTEHTYDAAGNVSSFTDKTGQTWNFSYDAINRMVGSINPWDEETKWQFEGPWLQKMIDTNGKITLFKRDGLGRTITKIRKMNDINPVVDEDDLVVEYRYNPYSQWTQRKGPLDRITYRTFDGLGRHEKITFPDSRFKSFSYTPAGKIASIREVNGNVRSFEYDKNGNLITLADSLGVYQRYSYNENDEMISREDAMGKIIQYAYDGIGRVTTISDPDLNTSEFVYDPMGRVLINRDKNKNEIQTSYNTSGRLASITKPTGAVTGYQYKTDDNLSVIIDANTNTSSYEYDELGRVKQINYMDNTKEEFTYDSLGYIQTQKLRNENLIQYVYDDAYRMVTIDYPGPGEDRSFSYDKAGRTLTADRANYSISMTYDVNNRPIHVVQNGKTMTYTYDDAKNTITLDYPGGDKVIYHRDLRGRVTQITRNTKNLVTDSYDADNRLVLRDFFNGIVGAFGYDDMGNIIQMSYHKGEELISGFEYGYDKEKNITWTKRLHDLEHSQLYSYDDGYRLTSYQEGLLDENNGIATPLIIASQVLDPMGNILSITNNGSAENRMVNDLNQYTTIDGKTLLYDANGNLSDDTIFEYAYTMDGQLQRITRKSDGQIISEYAYDAFLRRVAKTVNGDTTTFLYDNHHLIEEYSKESLSASYVFGGGLDDLVSRVVGGNPQVYLMDRLGSVQSLVDETGTIIENYRYSPYGRPEILNPSMQVLSGSMADNPYLFAGKRWDDEIHAYDSRRRTYHPGLKRFFQPDPMGYQDSLNLYQYAFNNPLRWIDPFGEDALSDMLYQYLGESETKRNNAMNVLNAAHQKGFVNEQQYAQSKDLINCMSDADLGARKASLKFAADTIQGLDGLRAERLPETLKQVLDKETWEQLAKSLITSPCSAIQCLAELARKIEDKDCEGASNMITRGALEVGTSVIGGVAGGAALKIGAKIIGNVGRAGKLIPHKVGKPKMTMHPKVKERLETIKYTPKTGISPKYINGYKQYTRDTGNTIYIRKNRPKAVAHEKKGTAPKPKGVKEKTTAIDEKTGKAKYPDEAVLHDGQKYSSDHDIYAIQKPDGTFMNSAEARVELDKLKGQYGNDRITDHGAHVNAVEDVRQVAAEEIGNPGDVFSISPGGKVLGTSGQMIKHAQTSVLKYTPGAELKYLNEIF
jgi:RHS repeat-associated protein